ncbi:hypothetical protein MKEN_00238200 [Mycena kentingensis (nom. inval.)]|nr:hypothetical protein MKEN_00238200 [Mycena kentingensis (nom. inval.)]
MSTEPSTTPPGPPPLTDDAHSMHAFREREQQGRSRENSSASAAAYSVTHSSPYPPLESSKNAASRSESLLNGDNERDLTEGIEMEAEKQFKEGLSGADIADASSRTGIPHFVPWRDDDLFDVFDLELVTGAGGKDVSIDLRYRDSTSSSSSGRSTYKITKKTRQAHFLAMGIGKKNMSIEVGRSIGWDLTNCVAASAGNKGLGYSTAFAAKDQPARSVSLRAAQSVLAKTAVGAPAARLARPPLFFLAPQQSVSSTSNSPPPGKRPMHTQNNAPDITNNGPALYEGGGYFIFSSTSTSPPSAAAPLSDSEDSPPPPRAQVLTTLYCTGYEQRSHARPGDVVVAELRLRPATAPSAPTWVRFFKERHAALHISRRGLAACMTGPQVRMDMAEMNAELEGRRAVLSRGQAIEVVLATLGTALLSIEHDGGVLAKRWGWLAPSQSLPPAAEPRRRGPPVALALDQTTSSFSPSEDPGLASPADSSPSDDSSQGPPTAHAFAFDTTSANHALPVAPAVALTPNRSASLHTPSISDREHPPGPGGDAVSVLETDRQLMIEEWMEGDVEEFGTLPPHLPHHPPHPQPVRQVSTSSMPSMPPQMIGPPPLMMGPSGPLPPPSFVAPKKPFAPAGAIGDGNGNTAAAPRPDSPAGRMFGGTWRRKGSGKKEAKKEKELAKKESKGSKLNKGKPAPPISPPMGLRHGPPHPQQQVLHQQPLAWPDKTDLPPQPTMRANTNRQSLILMGREKEMAKAMTGPGGGIPPIPDQPGFVGVRPGWVPFPGQDFKVHPMNGHAHGPHPMEQQNGQNGHGHGHGHGLYHPQGEGEYVWAATA